MIKRLSVFYNFLILGGLLVFPFVNTLAQSESYDLRLNDRSQIITPAQGTTQQFCSSSSTNLTFQVNNDGIDALSLTSTSMLATLTVTGNTFSSSSSNIATASFSTTSAGSPLANTIGAGSFAVFDWPTALQFSSTGSTTINIEVAPFGGSDTNTSNNDQSYEVLVLANPTQPTLSSNFGSGTITICQGDSVQLTSSAVGDEYEFYRNGVLLGPRQSSVSFTTSNLNHADVINVIAYFTTNCSSVNSAAINVISQSLPDGSIISDANNNVACEGQSVLFTAADLGSNPSPYFEFLVNNVSVQASSTTSTYTYPSVLTDNVVVTVRTWASSATTCYDEDSITLRLNSVSGSNQINGAQTICSGEDPSEIANTSVYTADLSSEGAVLSYQWQSRTSSSIFADITGATSLTYDPGVLTQTTGYRRLVFSTFNLVQCNTLTASATSNVVTITVDPNSTAVLTSNATNRTVCSGDDLILDASSSLNAASYRFYIDGNPQGSGPQSTATFTLNAGTFSDSSSITVRAYQGASGSGCYDDTSFVIRINSLTGTNQIGNSQNVCSGETPVAFTSISTPTSDRLSDGAVYSYQWQSRIGSNSYSNIIGATNEIFTPSSVATTTDYRRLTTSTFNSVTCSIISSSVQLTVVGGVVPSASFITSNPNDVICSDDSVLIDASTTVGGASYSYFINGLLQSGPTTSDTYTIPAGTLSDSDSVSVIAYSGLAGAGCTDTATRTLRVNSITGTTTLSGAQTICSGDTPSQLTGSSASSPISGTISYQWQSRTGTNSFTDISGATSTTFSPPALNVTTDFQRISTSIFNGVSCSVSSSIVRVTVEAAPSISLSGGSSAFCPGDTVVFTASGGVSYEYFVDGISQGATTTNDTQSITGLTNGQVVTVVGSNAQGCFATSTPISVTVTPMPSAAINSNATANTICSGDSAIFTASPAGAGYTYRFYIDGILQNLGVSTNTFDSSLATYTLLDSSVVSVFVENAASCVSSSSLTLRVLSTTGSNTISGTATICVGGDPEEFDSLSTPVAVAAGSVLSYQWQSRTNTGVFADIPGATSVRYDAPQLSATTAFRRIVYTSLNSVSCPDSSNIISGASNTVTITVDSTALPVVSFVSGVSNDVACAGDNLTFDASSTTGANSFEYFINNISQGPSSTATTLFVPAGTLADNSTVRVQATSTTASPCFSEFTITMRVNSFTGSNTVSNDQIVCENNMPTAFTSLSVPTPDISGAVVTYQWQSRTGSNPFTNIASTNSSTYSPPLLSTSTDFRRIVNSTFNGVTCTDISNSLSITVNPAPAASLVGTNTACIGDSVLFTASGGVSYEFFNNGLSLGATSTTNTISRSDLTNLDQITVQVIDLNGCSSISSPITMSITPKPSASISSGLTVDTMCSEDFPIFTAGPLVAGYTYNFYVNGNQQFTGVSGNVFDSELVSTTLTLTDNSLVAVEVINTNGCSDTATLTLRVNGLTGVNSISGVQTICSGGDPALITSAGVPSADIAGAVVSYQWQSKVGANPFSNIPGATSLNYDPSTLTTTTLYRRVAYATFNGVQCPGTADLGASNTVTVTVDSAAVPVINFTSGLSNDTLCAADSVTFDSTGTTGADSFEYFINGTSVGAAQASPTGLTYTPVAGSLNNSDQITVRAYSSSVTSCVAEQTITVTVLDFVGTNTVSNTQSICSGETPAQLTGTSLTASPSGTITYQWQSRVGTNTFVDISGANTQNYAPSALSTSTDFRRIVQNSFNSVVCEDVSNFVSITITPAPAASLVGTNTACVGDSVLFTASGGVSYEFFKNGTSLGATSTTNTISRSDLLNGDQITVQVIDLNGCSSISSPITMSITPKPSASISSGLTADTMCSEDFPIFTAGPLVAGYTYNFYVNGNQQFTGVSGNVFDSELVSTTLTLTDNSLVAVEVINTNGCSDTATLTLRVNGLTGANTITGSQTICSGGDPTILNSLSDPVADISGAVISYQWQSRNGSNPFSDIVGATSNEYDPSPLTSTTAFRRLVYSTFNGVQCPGSADLAASNTITVTVDSSAVPVISFTSGLPSNVLCQGESVTFDAAGTTGSATYEFFVNGVRVRSASASTSYTPVTGSLNDFDEIKVRANSSVGTSCFAEQSIIIRINEPLNANNITGSQTVCAGDIPALLTGTTVTGTPTISYQWQSRVGTDTFSDIAGATNITYQPSSLLQTTEFRRNVISTLNSVDCVVESTNTISVTVTPGPAPSAVLVSDQPSDTACAGEDFVFDASGSTGALSYEFFVDGVSAGAPSTTPTITLSLTDSQTVRVDAFPTAIGTGCASSQSISVRLNTIAGTNSIGAVQTICVGEDPLPFSSISVPSSSTGSLTYQWQSRTGTSTFSDITGATSLVYDPTSLSATTEFRRLAVSTLNGISCSEPSNVVTVTVDSSPTISGTLTSDQPSNTVCSGDPGMIVFTVNSAAASSTVFFINNSQVQSGTTQTYTASQSIFSNGDVVKTRLFNASGCYTEQTLIVSVNEVLPGSISGAQSVCSGTVPLMLSSVASGTINGTPITAPGTGNYQWQDSSDGIVWNDILTATSDSYTPTAASADTYYRRLTVGVLNGLSCSVPSNSFLVSVNLLPVSGLTADAGAITAPATMTSCINEQIDFIATGGVEYEFFVNGVSVQSRSSSATFSSSSLVDSDEVVVRAYDSTSVSACFEDSGIIDLTIEALPMASISSSASNDTFCTGDSLIFTAGSGGVVASYQFLVNGTSFQNSSTNIFDVSDYSLSITDRSEVEVIVTTPSGCSSNVSVILFENGISDFGTISSTTATVCINEIPDPIIGTTSTASGSISYQWQSSTDNITFNNISGAISSTYTPTSPLLVTTFYRRATESLLNSVLCEETTSSFRIAVSPLPIPDLQVTPGSLTAPATLTLCDVTDSAIFEANGGASYEFYVDGTVLQARSTINTFTATTSSTLLDNSTVFVRVFEDITGGCFADSSIITIDVTPQPTASLTSDKFAETFCTGEDIILSSTSNIPGSTFTFYIEGILQSGPSTTSTYTVPYGSIEDLDVVSVQVTTPGGCSTTSSVTFFENAISSIGTITTATPTICSGDVSSRIIGSASVASGTITYEWLSSLDNVTYTAITGTNSTSFNPGTLTTTTFFKRKTISTLNGVQCEALSIAQRIEIVSVPTGGILANPGGIVGGSTLTICDGTEVEFTGSGGASYEFTVDGITQQVRSNQSTFTTSSLLNNERVAVIVYNQPTGVASCFSVSSDITIEVNPVPVVTLSSDVTGNTFCTGDSVTFTATTNITTATYNFFVGANSYQNGTSNTFTPVPTLITSLNNNDIIRVEVSTVGGTVCSSIASLTLIENIITTPGTIGTTTTTICSGETPGALNNTTVASGSGVITYQWESGLSTNTFNVIPGAISANYTPTALTQTTYFRRQAISTLNAAACQEESNIIEIVVTPPLVGGTINPSSES
ncbi:hypothetical protein N9V61_04305, partial [Flavobacteriaceae bacterium]|nr:hypothetical protein [Flavobacteriaceae bacterium]